MEKDNTCVNCITLNEQCLQLKHEISLLNEKLDNLLEHVFHDKVDNSTQTTFQLFVNKDSCSIQTDMINCSLASTQTMQPHVVSSCSQTESCEFILNYQEDSLLDTFMEASENADSSRVIDEMFNSSTQSSIVPYLLLPDEPFNQFDIKKLENDVVYDIKLEKRSLCYYGKFPYSYGTICHVPKCIPTSGHYLSEILQHLNVILPDFKYNSVLITRYSDGKDCLGFHADNEPEIVPGSAIVTISLGQSRTIKFKQIPTSSSSSDHILNLCHGDTFIMSRESQELFEHSIPPDYSRRPRVSITCRLLQHSSIKIPAIPNNPLPTSISPNLPPPQPSSHINTQTQEAPLADPCPSDISVFISSSMFRGLDESKLSSVYQKAKVFFFPGATAEGILSKLKKEAGFCQVDSSKVKRVYLLCGTNNIDNILNVSHDNYNDIMTNISPSGYLVSKSG